MKKSKILMPLTGIAAIGAIAPVAVMTSCNKGTTETKVFDSIDTLNGGIYGKGEWLNDAGTKSKAATLSVDVKATIKSDAKAGTFYKHSWAAQNSTDGLITIEKKEAEEVTALAELVAGKTYVGQIKNAIKVNADVAITESRTFNFVVKYDEYETTTNGEKLIGSQDVTYKITLSKDKISFPTISGTTLTGSMAAGAVSGDTVTFAGWTASAVAATGTTLNVSYAFDEAYDINGAAYATSKDVLHIAKEKTCSIGADGALAFTGTMTFDTKPTTSDTFAIEQSTVVLTIKVTATDNPYVASTWYQAIDITAGNITVTTPA